MTRASDGGFSADWLALREPFDAQARDVAARRLRLVERLRQWRGGAASRPWRIIDLGCGTGANLRWLAPRLGGAQQWLAVDRDAVLLRAWAAAFEHAGPVLAATAELQAVHRRLDLARHLDALPWSSADLVTASALIDLVGRHWLHRLVCFCQAARAGVLLTLHVDGRHRWRPADIDDAWVMEAFARHQRRDKGFGAALGAEAVPVLAQALREAGYRVFLARSDWRLDAGRQPDARALYRAMVEGMGQAAREQNPFAAQRVDAWQARRLDHASGARLTVGHVDVLALPMARPVRA